MGFTPYTRAMVWGTPESISPTLTKLRVSIGHKDKSTQEFKIDFSGYVGFCGSAIASKALSLKEGDRITLKRVDVTNKYDKEKKITYTNFWCYDFEPYVYNPDGYAGIKEYIPELQRYMSELSSGEMTISEFAAKVDEMSVSFKSNDGGFTQNSVEKKIESVDSGELDEMQVPF